MHIEGEVERTYHAMWKRGSGYELSNIGEDRVEGF